VQNHQVADIIRATGHQPSSLGFTKQLYSSAPSSTVAVNRLTNSRPPVPLFRQSTGSNPHNQQQNKMFSDPEDFNTAFGGIDMSRSASSSTNMGTISPQELLMSAPGSAVFTNLTSPSIYTPELDGADVSPAYQNVDWDLGDNPDNWASLFPENDNLAQSFMVDQSPALVGADIDGTLQGQERRKSSNVSPKSGSRQSVRSGVGARKREKSLPPIIVDDPLDTVAVKRARNTLAARKSRQRKAQKMEEYEATIDEKDAEIERLIAERDHWKALALGLGAKEF